MTSGADSGSYIETNNGGNVIVKYLKGKGFEHINPRLVYKQFPGELIKLNHTVHGLLLKLFRKRPAAQKRPAPTIPIEDQKIGNSGF